MLGNALLNMPPVSTNVGFVGVYLSRVANTHERVLCFSQWLYPASSRQLFASGSRLMGPCLVQNVMGLFY